MPEVTQYAPGMFCWADVCARDLAASKRFYTELFGWSAVKVPAGAGVYCTFSKDGRSVCGLYPAAEGPPPAWQGYISVESADATADKATQLGGSVVTPPFDAMDAGRSAVLRDPTGAVFAVWQPKAHIGAALTYEPGALCWNELLTTDVTAAEKFYGELFGWTAKTSPSPTGYGEYTEFKLGDRSVGGMMAIQASWGEIPPNWIVYFVAESCDRAIGKAESLGGKVEFPPMDIPNVGRFAYVADPQGAVFAVISLAAGAAT